MKSFLQIGHSLFKNSLSMPRTAPSSISSEVNTHSEFPVNDYALTRDLGAQGCLGVVPESASIANRVFSSFLARLPPSRSDPLPPHSARFEDALQRLSEIVQNPAISSRDPCSPMTFSCVPPAVVRRRTQIYAQAAAGHRCAFSPLDNNGRPKRKYVILPSIVSNPSLDIHVRFGLRFSERVQEEWFEIDRNWVSYSSMCVCRIDENIRLTGFALSPSAI